jgi:hypothetical protein
MLKEKIKKYFRDYPQLRVLFFFDKEENHREEMATLEVTGIRIVRWSHNDFLLKTKLHGDWLEEKVFLYFPVAAPNDEAAYRAFPLLDLMVANKVLALDDLGEFMQEFGLNGHQKGLVREYMSELQYKTVQDVCRPILTSAKLQKNVLQQGILSAILGFSKIESWSVLLGKLFTLGLPEFEKDLVRVTKKVLDNRLLDILQEKSKEYLGVALTDLSTTELLGMLQRILYNKITQTISVVSEEDDYARLKIIKPDGLIRFNQFLQEVEQNKAVQERLTNGLRWVEQDIRGEKLIGVYGAEADFSMYTSKMLWSVLTLRQKTLSINPVAAIEQLEQLSLQPDLSDSVAESLAFMIESAKMFAAINRISSYVLDHPDAYIQQYARAWMKIDTAYRRAIFVYQNLDKSEIPTQLDIENINAEVNKSYEQHIDKLNREWLKSLAHVDFDYKKLTTAKQYDFYEREVANSKQKVVVIISDALRYEAGVELLGEMHGDNKNIAKIGYQLASIPSKTSIGMAQLLPGTKKIWQANDVIVDGISSSGTENRQKIVQSNNEKSTAVRYENIKDFKEGAMRELFKEKSFVYVFHDVIDATGDKKPSERRTFGVVEECIKELKRFIKMLHSSYGVRRVIITADHGFLYNDRKIEDKDKENLSGYEALQTHNRYEIVKENKAPTIGYKIPLSATTQFDDDLFVLIPDAVNRYKKAGVGHQFVHGGASLQELVVPVIESSRAEKEVTKKVKPMLLSTGNLRMVSNILTVQVLQENKVSRFEKELTVNFGLYKDSTLVSNEVEILLNETSESPSSRMHRVELTLSGTATQETFLRLKAFDAEKKDKLNPLIDVPVQNNTLIQADF